MIEIKQYHSFKLIVLFVFLSISFGYSQATSSIQFKNIDIRAGLPSNNVQSIIRDNLGFLWIATTDGLCRYEPPSRMKSFQKINKEDEEGLLSSNIRSIYLDKKDNLWVGTRLGGLSRLHQPTGVWKTFIHDSDNTKSISNDEILNITEDTKGRLWVGTEDGLNLFNSDTETFTTFQYQEENLNGLRGKAVLSIMEDDQGWIWVGTWGGGLHLLLPTEDGNIENATFRQILPAENKPSHNVWKVYQDNQKRYWVGTHGGGLYLMQLPTNASNDLLRQDWQPYFLNYYHLAKKVRNISSNTIQDIFQDSRNRLWVATGYGLNYVDEEGLPPVSEGISKELKDFEIEFQNLYFDPTIQTSIASNSINSIYEDSQGLIWFGTFTGISLYNWYVNQFNVYELADNKYDAKEVKSIYIDENKIAWLGTGGDGFMQYDFENDELIDLNTKQNKLQWGNEVNAVDYCDEDHLYIGSSKGVSIFNKKTLKYKNFGLPDWLQEEQDNLIVRKVYKDKKGRLWVISGEGLFQINEETGAYMAYYHNNKDISSISDNSINDILEDLNGNIWVATYNGLNLMKTDDSGNITFEQIKHDTKDNSSIHSNRIMCLEELNGKIYIGTTNGLSEYDNKTKKFKNHSKEGHKYWIQSIEKSTNGALWASTTEGIFFFDTKTETFNVFEQADGLNDITFQPGSKYKDENGFIYFGSRRGISRVQPNKILTNQMAPPVYVTDVKLLDPKGEKTLNVTYQDELILNHDHYYLALNYNRPEKNKFAYKLDGFDESWNYTMAMESLTAVYTNLEHGEYTLLVKASNNDGVWTTQDKALKIVVKPAIWETWWFLLGSLLTALIITFFGMKWYTRKVRRNNLVLKKYNENLNKEILERKRIEEALHEREQYMEYLVQERTKELEVKNEEVESLLQKIQLRNEELEVIVEKRTRNLKSSNLELTRSNKDLEQFAYIASHDLQEPLRIVGNFVGLLGRKYKDNLDEAAFEYIDFAVDGVKRMSNLIKSLLTYSRVGRTEIEFSNANLNDVLELKKRDLSQLIKERKITLEIKDMPTVYCERNQIAMVFYNLMNNAIKFNKSEEPQVIVSPFYDVPDSCLGFSVADNGIGIDPEFKDQIFEIFRRLHNKQDYEGTGIGLSLCKKIIERHGGKIWVESVPGEGTTFFFTISKNLETFVREKTMEEDILSKKQFSSTEN